MPTEKERRALELRDAALAVLRRRGSFQDHGGVVAYECDCGDMKLLMRTPFLEVPGPSERDRYLGALLGLAPPEFLAYGLDIFAPGKVLNMEWDGGGDCFHVTTFKRGAWEAELMAAR